MYIFKTDTTMKQYNCKKWWIENDIVGEFVSDSDSLKEALKEYAEFVNNECGIAISKNAMNNLHGMYVDTDDVEPKQIGYVITGSTEFDKGDYTGWSKQFVDLWVQVITAEDTDFSEVPVEY